MVFGDKRELFSHTMWVQRGEEQFLAKELAINEIQPEMFSFFLDAVEVPRCSGARSRVPDPPFPTFLPLPRVFMPLHAGFWLRSVFPFELQLFL